MRDYSPHQKKIIRRYYDNADGIGYERLAELVAEIYLAEGKKAEALWKRVASAMELLQVPPGRRDHILEKRDPKILAELVKELTGRG